MANLSNQLSRLRRKCLNVMLLKLLVLACIPLNLHIAHASDKIKRDVDKNYNDIYDKGAESNEVSPEYDEDYGEGAYDGNYDYAYDNYVDVDTDEDEDLSTESTPLKDSNRNNHKNKKSKNKMTPTEIDADDIEIDDDYEGDYEISLDDGEEDYQLEKIPTKAEIAADAANARWANPTRKVSLKYSYPLTLIYKVEISDDCSHYYNAESIPYYIEGYTYAVLNNMDKSIKANTTAVVFIGCQISKYSPKFVFEVEYYFLENRWDAEMLKKLTNIYKEEIILNTPSDIRIIDLADIKIVEEIHKEAIKDENSLVSWVIGISTFLGGLLIVIGYYCYRNRENQEDNQYQGGSPISSAPNTPSTDDGLNYARNCRAPESQKLTTGPEKSNSESQKPKNSGEEKNFCMNLKDVTTGLFNKQRHESGRTNTSNTSNPSSQTSNFSSGCFARTQEAGRNTLQRLRGNEAPTESPVDFRRSSRSSNRIVEDSKEVSGYPSESIVLKSGVTENSSLHSPEYDVPRGLNNHNFTASAATFNTPGSPNSSSYANHTKPTPPSQPSKSSPFLVTATVPNSMGHQSSDQLLKHSNKVSESSTPSLVDEFTEQFDKYSNHTLPPNNYRNNTGHAKPKRGNNLRSSRPQQIGQYSLPKIPYNSNNNNSNNITNNSSNLQQQQHPHQTPIGPMNLQNQAKPTEASSSRDNMTPTTSIRQSKPPGFMKPIVKPTTNSNQSQKQHSYNV